jgi:hypothetical protein
MSIKSTFNLAVDCFRIILAIALIQWGHPYWALIVAPITVEVK